MPDRVHVSPGTPSLVLRCARRYGGKPAFIGGEKVITYRAVGDFIGRAQQALAAEGAKPGEFIATLSRNGAEAWILGVAAQAMGMRLTCLHPMGSLHDHLRHLAAADVRWVFIDAESYGQRGAEIAAAAAGCKVYGLGTGDFGRDMLARIAAAASATPIDVVPPDGIVACQFTGGTTGVPKQFYADYRRSAAGFAAFSANFEIPEMPRLLAAGPVSHVTGAVLMPTLLRGGSVHMLPGFDVSRVIETIERDRINTAVMVPTMIYTLLDSPALAKADMRSLEFVLYSASPMSPPRLMEALDRIGPVFAQLYAQSECGPIAYMPKRDHDPARPENFSACGFPVPECTVRLLDAADADVAVGEPGEIVVRAAHAFNGYHNNPEANAEVFRGGWLHTGDIARADEEGRLFIVDRKKDMIVTGGFNVYPREVENAIATLSEVAAVAVIGIPDPHWGEAVCAYVVARPGGNLTPEAVVARVKNLKGSVHAPKTVRVVERLPLTNLGKIDKKTLREAAWAGAGRRVG